MSIEIDARSLTSALRAILGNLEDGGQASFRIDSDYYWFVSREARYNPYETPTQLTLGQLSDDWSEVKAIADGNKEPIGYALVWLSQLLLAIGENTVG